MSKKLIFVIIICTAAHIIFRAKFITKYKPGSVYTDIHDALRDEMENRTFLKMLNNIYVNYEHHKVNAIEKFIVKWAKGDFWINSMILYIKKFENLRNEFPIKLLKEMRNQKDIGSLLSEDEVEDILYRLEQLYADRIKGPSSGIIEETAIEVAPVYTTSYRLGLLEFFEAALSDFVEFEKDAEAYWTILGTFCINYTSENIINAIKFLDEEIKEYSMRTKRDASMLLNALISRLQYLSEADSKKKCYVELLKGLQRKKMIGTYFNYEIDEIIDRLEPSLWAHAQRRIYKFFEEQ